MADFGTQLNRLLQEYGDEVLKDMGDVINGVGKAAANKVKAASPKKTGKYATGWRTKTEGRGYAAKITVYNAKKPGLAHLLEHGHALYKPGKNGKYIAAGRVKGQEHIKPVEEWANDEVIRRLEAKLRK